MRFLLPLPTQRVQHTGQEGGHIAPIDCWAGLVANRSLRFCCTNPKLDHATSLETEVWQTMDALIYGSFHKTGEGTISSHSIWFNCKGPSETQHTEPKKKKEGEREKNRLKKLCSIWNTCQKLDGETDIRLLSQSKFCPTDIHVSHHV